MILYDSRRPTPMCYVVVVVAVVGRSRSVSRGKFYILQVYIIFIAIHNMICTHINLTDC